MKRGKTILSLLAPMALVASVQGQEIQTEVRSLIHEGQTIIGVGPFEDSRYVFVDGARTWVAVGNADIEAIDLDELLLRNWLVTFREGSDIFGLDGALTRLRGFGPMDMTAAGDLAMLLEVQAARSGTVLYWGSFPVMHHDDPITGPGIGANSVWRTFDNVKANSKRQVMLLGKIQNTAIPGDEIALVRLQLGPQGAVESTEILATNNMVLGGMDGLGVKGIDSTVHAIAMNERGEWIAPVKSNGVDLIYISLNGTTTLAHEGGPSSLPNRIWRSFSLVFRSDINDLGETIFTGATDVEGSSTSSTYVITKNGVAFAREGQILPEFSSSPLGKGNGSPLILANNGDVFWWAQDTGSAEAHMRNYKPIVKIGTTRVNGNLVTEVARTSYAFSASSDGRFWVGRVRTAQEGDMVVFADFGLVLPVPGCYGNEGKLELLEGQAYPGDHLLLGMSNAQDIGVLPLIQISTQRLLQGPDCGVLTAFGEILFSPANRILRQALPAWDGASPSTLDLLIPNSVGLVDATFYMQGVFIDVGNVSPEVDFRLTNALKVQIGAP